MERKAKASPTKAFFVRMLTRDISLTDCILDLVDNCVDGAWNHSGHEPVTLEQNEDLGDYWVSISADPAAFSITDNCGGITLEDAEEYAFTFGRRPEQPTHEFNVGVYGIGMKRAAFKLGNHIRVHSTYVDENLASGLGAFVVDIDVPGWLDPRNPVWDFDISESEPADEPGVEIVVTQLHAEVVSQFDSPDFLNELHRVLERDYLLPVLRGLRIELNGKRATPHEPRLRTGEGIAALHRTYEDGPVRVEILAGMAAAPPDDTGPEVESRADTVSGWYVLCNGRAVTSADRSLLTGWGQLIPRWHSQYSGFLGFVLFSSSDPSALPTTTTKRSLDVSSPVYLRALANMRDPMRAWIDYTNMRKPNLDLATQLESKARPVALTQVPESPALTMPTIKKKPKGGPEVANVLYTVELSRMTALARAFGSARLSYREVGRRSFEFTYERMVDEDDE